jgi:hypothetical protein
MNSQELNPELPLLTELTFDGVAPTNPLVLLFRVGFRDSDEDLSQGTLTLIINGEPSEATAIGLQELFTATGLPLTTVAGTLEFVLEVQLTVNSLPTPGSTFDVGVQAVDGAGHESNTPTVTLQIDY